MPEDNEIIDQTTDETVLSKKTDTETSEKTEGSESEKQTVASEEDSQKKRDSYLLRQEKKRWKEKLSAIRDEANDDDIKAAIDLASREGYDTSDDKAKKQVELIAKSADLIATRKMERQKAAEEKILLDTSTDNLREALTEMGYEKGTSAYKNAGQILFNHYGVGNPDVFSEIDQLEKVIEFYAQSLTPKKKEKVDEFLLKKAGSSRGSAESRTESSKKQSVSDVKFISEKYRVSESAAKEMIEKQKKLPKFAR